MRFSSFSDPRVQQRVSQLAGLLKCSVPFAVALIVERLKPHENHNAVYRMFAGQKPWNELVVHSVLDLLAEQGLCGPNLLNRLFDPAEPAELIALGPQPEAVRPSDRSVKKYHKGIELPAEERVDACYVISGILPPEVSTRAAMSGQMRATIAPYPKRQKSITRGATAWANLKRASAEDDERLIRLVYLPEAVLLRALQGVSEFSNMTHQQCQQFYDRLEEMIRLHRSMRVGLIDESALKASDAKLISGVMHVLCGSILDPSLRVQWPAPHAMIHYWKKQADESSLISPTDAAAFKRIIATLTHLADRQKVLEQLKVLARHAGLRVA